jgi:hypothetical protein
LGVGAAALGAIALVKAFTPQAAPAAVPAAAVVPPPIVTSPAPPAEVSPASNPEPKAVVPPPIVPAPAPVTDTEFGAPGAFDTVIINNASATSIDTTGLDAQIAANQRQADIIAEQQTVSQASLAADQAAADAATVEVIQAQKEADDQRAFDSGYNNIEDLKAAEDQQVLDQIVADQTAAEAASELTREANRGDRGLTVAKAETAGAPTKQDTQVTKGDWRVKLSLAPGANYLYKIKPAGILQPLSDTDGVIFPYTPNIQVSYAAHYDPAELTHSNYKIFQYKNSSVDNITITCDFTAQDTAEANYLLAVIHFFRSVTKMFYGKDGNPIRGTPPPLCYLTGLGQFQFDQHPLAITGFNYTLPIDVDYIRANSTGTSVAGGATPTGGAGTGNPTDIRLAAAGVQAAAAPKPPRFNFTAATNTQSTYVPTKMQISITAIPIVSRADISKEFSLKKYATGELLQGSKRPGGGGIW